MLRVVIEEDGVFGDRPEHMPEHLSWPPNVKVFKVERNGFNWKIEGELPGYIIDLVALIQDNIFPLRGERAVPGGSRGKQ